ALPATVACLALMLQLAIGQQLYEVFYNPRAEQQARANTAEAALRFLLPRMQDRPVVWAARSDDVLLVLPVVRGLMRCGFTADFPDALPDPTANRQPQLEAGRTLVVIDEQTRGEDAINAALASHGYRLDVSASRYFPFGERSGFKITIGKVGGI